MSASVYLGIDLGTSAVKILAMRSDGAVLAKEREDYATLSPQPGWNEQSPHAWWQATCSALGRILAHLGPVEVAGVGFSGQLNGFVLVDEGDAPIGEALIWLDIRASDIAAQMARDHGERIKAISHNQVTPIAVLPKLKWVAQHRPEVLARAKRLFLVKDFILWKLTGAHATDPSDAAATGLMDYRGRRWSPELCALAGVDPAILPVIRSSDAIVGRITAAAAAQCGIPPGVPVVAGAGDVTALSVGCGVIDKGVAAVTLGTAGHVVLSEDRHPDGRAGEVWELSHAAPDKTIWLGLVMSGGLSISWFRSVLRDMDYAEISRLAEHSPPGARGVLFLPFLEGASTPYHQPEARAAFLGLSSSHGTGDMIRSVLEGVAYNIRECLDLFQANGAEITELRIGEGGSRIEQWCQIIADVVNRPVHLLAEMDASALGAAVLACAGAEDRPVGAIADQVVALSRSFLPDAARASVYEGTFRSYQKAVGRLLPGS